MCSKHVEKYREFDHKMFATNVLLDFQKALSIEKLLVDAIKLWWEGQGKGIGIDSYDVVSIGKASFEMASIVEKKLPVKFNGICLCNKKPRGISSKWKCFIGNHPIPGKLSQRSTREICKYLKASKSRGIIYLISGGGSSMLCQPVNGLTLKRKIAITEKLLTSGLSIKDINTLRKHLSIVKGGGLARIANKEVSATFILCDMNPEDWMDVASSPSLPDSSTINDAKRIADRLSLGDLPFIETPKPGEAHFKNSYAVPFFDTDEAISKFISILKKYGFYTKVLNKYSEKTASEIADTIAGESLQRRNPVALIGMGEGRVRCNNEGIGGRCSHLAALVLDRCKYIKKWAFIAYATDGCDGNTNKAGALVGPWLSHYGLRDAISSFNTGKWMNKNNASLKVKSGNNLRDLWVLLKWRP